MNKAARLPPLNALRVLHEVARQNSLRGAAETLYVTPQAVGQQIRQLEDFIGVALLERGGRKVRLTEQGIILSHHLAAGFEEFHEGLRRITEQTSKGRINLNATPYFATRYLMPRLSHLRDAMPDSELALTTMVDLLDLGRENIDLSIQWGYGASGEHLLLRDPKVICCTPDIAEKIHEPADLLHQTLLQPVRSLSFWPDIFHHLQLEIPHIDMKIGFDDAATMRRATLQGLGVGLVSELDAEEALLQGTLVAPLGKDCLADMPQEQIPGFYLDRKSVV